MNLKPCPHCGSADRLKLQTPPDDDKIVRRVYWRCFGCGYSTGAYPDWAPCHWRESGQKPYAPLVEFWNNYVSALYPTA